MTAVAQTVIDLGTCRVTVHHDAGVPPIVVSSRVAEWIIKIGLRSGPAFRHLRQRLGVGVEDVAVMFDVNVGTVYRWEREASGLVDQCAFQVLCALVQEQSIGRHDLRDRLYCGRFPVIPSSVELTVPSGGGQ